MITRLPSIRAVLLTLMVLAGFSYPISSQPSGVEDGVQVTDVKQLMEEAARNVESYSYSIDAETRTIYANKSGTAEIISSTKSNGAADIPSSAAKLLMSTTQEMDGRLIAAQDSETYLIKDSSYENVNGKWFRYAVMNESRSLSSMNEIVGQSDLTARSNLVLAGEEVVDGVDCYKLQGTPERSAYNTLMVLQALVAYSLSPIPLPVDLLNMTFGEMISGTEMSENGNVTITSWVSKDSHLLKKSVIETHLTLTPEIMNLSQDTEDFKIEVSTVETTLFSSFNETAEISLPEEARNAALVVPQNTSSA
jgi:hypothetical protein